MLHCIIPILKDKLLLRRLIAAHPFLLNAKKEDGMTPLLSAVSAVNMIIAQRLIERGADITIKDESDNTILHYYARYNVTDIIPLLLDKKIDLLNYRNSSGYTALMIDSSEGYSGLGIILYI